MVGYFDKKLSYRCTCCGEQFDGSPSFAYSKPIYYFWVPEEAREDRITIDTDTCHIRADPNDPDDHDIYAIRATLDIPINDVEEPFCWGLWVTVSEVSYKRYLATYDQDQSEDGCFAWLSVTMPYYNSVDEGQSFENLACDLHWGVQGQRPKIVLHESDHLLYQHQSNGIDWHTAIVIAQDYLKELH